MKIVHIGPAYPLRGGIANFNETLAKACSDAGHESEIISYSLQYPSFLFPGKTQFSTDKYNGSTKIETQLNSVNPLNWIKVGRYLKKEKADVILMHLWMPFFCPALGTIARIVKKNNHTKVFVLCHNVIPHEKKIGDRFLTNMFVPHADGFISMSQSVLTDLEQFTNCKNKLFIPHPIYDIFGNIESKTDAQKALNLDTKYKYILFFGMVRKYKGLDLLIEAFGKLSASQPDTRLLVAGEFYDQESVYTELIERLGISDKVIIRNEFIPTDEVKHYFSASDIVAQTYKTATQSGVTQIAYHFHRPMLVTNVGGLAEIVPPSVGYITEKDPADIASKLEDFFVQSKEEEMSKAVAIDKKKFGWDTMVTGIEQLYKG